MGKRGPKPKPTALKVLHGNPGHRPLNTLEPMPEAGMPPRPAGMDEDLDACAIWDELAPELYATGVLTVVDGPALSAFCTAYSVWIRAERRMNADRRNNDAVTAEGLLVRTKQGNLIQNPLLGIANVARRDMVKLGAELGLTPSSRANLEGRKRETDDTDEKYFGKRRSG
jgi:P27 family predicted phage terminase small subunit